MREVDWRVGTTTYRSTINSNPSPYNQTDKPPVVQPEPQPEIEPEGGEEGGEPPAKKRRVFGRKKKTE